MAYTVPTFTDFKSYFNRDFPYGNADLSTVQDNDITKAIAEAGINFNAGLWSTQAEFTMAYLYLTAHYLCMDLRASSQGINGSYSWLVGSKGVGSVSEGIVFPDYIMKNALLAMYSKTNYGAKFLSLIIPRLMGQAFTVTGCTKPG